MRKLVVGLTVAAVGLVPVLSADAAKKPKRVQRVVSSAYDAPAPGVAGIASGGNCGSPNTGCAKVTLASNERYISVEITDSSGLPASGAIYSAQTTLVGTFCGKTEEALLVDPGVELTIWAHAGPTDSNPCPGVATSGSIVSTLSNLP